MPTYDYVCAGCRHCFERFEPISDDAIKACPKCGRKKARRMLGSGAGLIFKGAGFYATDYKRSAASSSGGGGDKKKTTRKEAKKEELAK